MLEAVSVAMVFYGLLAVLQLGSEAVGKAISAVTAYWTRRGNEKLRRRYFRRKP